MSREQWEALDKEIVGCCKCPRIVEWRNHVACNPPERFRGQKYWSKPLTGFGDKNAPILIVGLAPAAHGGNRTGRMFTGDDSGKTLMSVLYEVGLANQPHSVSLDDGLVLKGVFITAVLKCAPPNNKPTSSELDNCKPYLLREILLLTNVKTVVCLGRIAYENLLKTYKLMGFRVEDIKFSHGVSCKISSNKGIQITVLARLRAGIPTPFRGGMKASVTLKSVFLLTVANRKPVGNWSCSKLLRTPADT